MDDSTCSCGWFFFPLKNQLRFYWMSECTTCVIATDKGINGYKINNKKKEALSEKEACDIWLLHGCAISIHLATKLKE